MKAVTLDVVFRLVLISGWSFWIGTMVMSLTNFSWPAWLWFAAGCYAAPACALVDWAVFRPK